MDFPEKLLVHLVARDGAKADLARRLPDWTRSLCALAGMQDVRGTALVARDQDPLRLTGLGQPAIAFDATVAICGPSAGSDARLAVVARDLHGEFGESIHRHRSILLLGTDATFVDCDPMPIRYQYCMRRRPDFTSVAYRQRYTEIHSTFGIRTKGISGYTQFHVDADASPGAAVAAGVGPSDFDSVSELHLHSLEEFFGAAAWNQSLGAQEDEDRFVDRARSVMWLSDVVSRA